MGGRQESYGNLVELEMPPPQSGGIVGLRMKTLVLVRTEGPQVKVIVVVVVVIVVVECYCF